MIDLTQLIDLLKTIAPQLALIAGAVVALLGVVAAVAKMLTALLSLSLMVLKLIRETRSKSISA